jgi:large subunit ribosomal protein L3
MIQQLLATKSHMTQAWTKSGVRIPVTIVKTDNFVIMNESKKEDRVLAGQGTKKLKNVARPQRAQLEKAGISFGLRQIKEIKIEGDKSELAVGTIIKPSQVLKVGDIVKATGTSIGKGFTGVVKRHGFAGGPRTHGQSDRERAPGSIGSGTTPGRVYRNKRMAGRSGNATVTTLNLRVIGVDDATNEIRLSGIVPGTTNSFVILTKTGESEFEGLLETFKTPKVIEAAPVVEETVVEAAPEEVPSAEATPEETK